MADERILGCINVQGGGLRPPHWTLVITDRRAILARRTKELEAAHAALHGGGGGLFRRKPAGPPFIERYWTIPPDAILAETPGNQAFTPSNVQLVEVIVGESPNDETGPDHFLVINVAGPGLSVQAYAYEPFPPAAEVRDALRVAFGGLVRG